MQPLGPIDHQMGELWVANPFLLVPNRQNLSAFERNRLFLNDHGKSFIDASFVSAADILADSRSVVAADFDRDAAPDLLVASDGGGPLRLFLNRFPRNSARIRLKLVGHKSNRAGVGSRVELECGGRRILRDMFIKNSCLAMQPVEPLIGLGAVNQIDRLSIRWPTGQVQKFTKLPTNVIITITEGSSEWQIEPLSPDPT